MLKIVKMNTKPELDPYSAWGAPAWSKTVLELHLADRTISVDQEWAISGSMDRVNGLVLCAKVRGHPLADDMRAWIEREMPNLEKVADGANEAWVNGNRRFTLEESADELWQWLRNELADGAAGEWYQAWSVGDWCEPLLDTIMPDTSDEELEKLASDWTPIDEDVVLSCDILEYLTKFRDSLRAEAE